MVMADWQCVPQPAPVLTTELTEPMTPPAIVPRTPVMGYQNGAVISDNPELRIQPNADIVHT